MNDIKKYYILFLKEKKYYIPKIQETIITITKKVADELLVSSQYTVESTVSEETFKNFIKYWEDQTKVPKIDPKNFGEYQQLSQEFGMLNDILISQVSDPLFNILSLSTNSKCDKSMIETIISRNLDQYLDEKYAKHMYNVPIQSLYNIFNNKERILHNQLMAYRFITNTFENPNQNYDPNLFILIKSLDGDQLYSQSPELFFDLISKCSESGFIFQNLNLSKILNQRNPILQKELKELILTNNYKELRDKITKEQINFLEFPDEVTDIPDIAFFRCKSLKKVIMPMNLKTIGNYAFFGCFELAEIFIPDTVDTIRKGAFCACLKLEKIKLPSKLRKIENNTFDGCLSLKGIEFPKSITEIGESSFHYCHKIECLTIPESLTTINSCSFCFLSSLTKVTLPLSLTKINAHAFHGCTKLEKIEIPSSVKEIQSYAFNECSSLKEIKIPDEIKTIEPCVFLNCTSLEEVILPLNLESIKDNAFENCHKLQKINIPGSVTLICRCAFCSCTSLTSVVIPDKINYIGFATFYNCTSLSHVEFPNSDIGIEECAFYNCPNLSEVEIKFNSSNQLRYKSFDEHTTIKLK